MRIGEFASKLNITQDTVRHYMDLGLLIPQKNGGQYFFEQDDMDDMEKIMNLKQLNFSLTEILKVLSYKRMTGMDSEEYRTLYLSLLEEKKNKIDAEVQKHLEVRSKLRGNIDLIKSREKRELKRIGFPIAALTMLACPQCRAPLHISDGTIEKNMIFEADIQCDCGYNAIIEDGIYVDPKVRKITYPDGSKFPTREEFLAAASTKYINLRYKAMDMVIEAIQKESRHPRYILEIDPCICLFLMQYIKHLPMGTTYILNYNDFEKLNFAKKEIEANYDHKHFIFFCCDVRDLPLAKNSLDIIVDFLMTKAYARSEQEFVVKRVLPLLQMNGLLTGVYPYVKPRSQNALVVPSPIRDYLNKEHIHDKLSELGVMKMRDSDLGPVVENNPYETDIRGKELFFNIFAGKPEAALMFKPIGQKDKEKFKAVMSL
ncbi:MerR family transcriptional regulator [Desulfitobacterium chlororespirans]|uniref:DNA-binding transcriptional regulator, MerR family n=1 Tax=Desulfitobacterium chlororespirans DSM 11544 TaxID=1121395 RepID=A0A1M7TF98_9FIRM|nr:MerR family transcriptional regulator [Desulfitobacterium chlororespirans]SHN69338.1 DNA-binding transcriptional regulator, MerR family [Desulfitobacterium chlororespirans DSM 11544]